MLFPINRGRWSTRTVGHVHAVDDVSFALNEGETLGIVGESGCGKTTLIRTLVRLVDATAGAIRFRGTDITHADRKQLAPIRREMQMVFQDPAGVAQPAQAGQPDPRHAAADPRRAQERDRGRDPRTCSTSVGLHPEHLNRFPHEFSGGQRQRIGIARALAVEPEADPARRAGVGARRLDPGPGDQPARGAAGRAPPLVRVRRPRPRRGAPRLGPDHRHVPRQADGALAGRGAVRQADPPVHLGAARRRFRSPTPTRTVRAQRTMVDRRAAEPDRPAGGCRFHTRCPHATEICRDGRAAADRVCATVTSPPATTPKT